MKKAYSRLLLTITSLMYGGSVLALEPPPTIDGLDESMSADGIFDAIVNILVIVLDFVALLAVVFIVIAGIRLVVSGGDEGEKDKAKQTIIYVIAGLIVIIFARTIVVFVIDSIGGGG